MSDIKSPADGLRILRVIWGAMLAAPLVYAGIAIYFSLNRSGSTIDPELVNWAGVFLGLLSFLILLFVFLFRQITAAFAGGRYLNGCIIRWVMVESIAIFGLVLLFMGLDLFLGLLFFIAALGGMALLPPSETEQENFAALSE